MSTMLLQISWSGCRKNNVLVNQITLEFSSDTLMFDTVFTKLGNGNPPSMYQYLVVHNPNTSTIKTNIRLAGGGSSPFRMNVDGIPGPVVNNVEIRAKDSLFIFVEAYPDQSNQNNPLVYTDSIVFENTKDLQNVKVVCWGQDAHYLYDSVMVGNITWNDQVKPYVIYNSALIDPNSKLTVGPGVHVYSHNNSKLFVQGTLQVNGDTNKKVIFEGDRLQYSYKDEPNQWRGIRFLPGSSNNSIKNAIIKNATIGIEVDSTCVFGSYNIILENVEIRNHSLAGIYNFMGSILGKNVLVANCGEYSLAGLAGGTYHFYHSTFACYSTKFNRNKEHFGISNKEFKDTINQITYLAPLKIDIENCIIYGDQDDELVLVFESTPVSILFASNLLKIKDPNLISLLNNNGNIMNNDVKFNNVNTYDFSLNKNSPAIDKGIKNLNTPITDILGKIRDQKPDLGCYEY